MTDQAPLDSPEPSLTLTGLFLIFAKISLSGFGGVLAWTHRALVEQKRWLTPREFNELLALSQFLPGPNIVNLSVVFGSRLLGVGGAVAALLGLTGPPLVLVIGMGILYAHYGDIDELRQVLAAVAAAAAGLVLATVAKLALPLFRGGLNFAPFVAVACFVAIGVMRWPLPFVLLALAPLSIGIAYWSRR